MSNKYGIVFAAIRAGVVAFKTDELHTLDEDTSFATISDIGESSERLK